MAGEGSRFREAGFIHPKPFIDVNGNPMIYRVMDNLNFTGCEFILIAKNEHINIYNNIFNKLKTEFNITNIIGVDYTTEGTACTNMFAAKHLKDHDEVIIANSDQFIDLEFETFYKDAKKRNLDGSILTFNEPRLDNKWSYAKINTDNLVIEVKEKEAISSNATVGIYYFANAKNLILASLETIISNDRVNNEFYTCPVYNYLIKDKKSIGIFEIEKDKMFGLGTPDDLAKFLKSPHA